MGKSYKQFYCHNTKLVEKKGWPTTDKKGTVVIEDTKNGFHFEIVFGKEPNISIFKMDKHGRLCSGDLVEAAVKVKAIELRNKEVKLDKRPTKNIPAEDRSKYNDIDDFFNKP